MIIEFDFEIYKRGDCDKVYLRNGKEVRILCDNGKGNCPIVAMFDNNSGKNYTILRYDKTGRRYIDQQSNLDLMLSVKEWEPELWVVVISYMDNEEDGCFDELCEKIRVKRDRIYNMEIISLSDDKATV